MIWTRLILAAALTGCVSTKATTPPEPTPLVITRMEVSSPEPGAPYGWIYAFDRPAGKPDLCVTIWPDETWSLAAVTEPGYYGDELARGCVILGTAVEFPADELRGAGHLYVSGGVGARLDGEPIPRGASDVPR